MIVCTVLMVGMAMITAMMTIVLVLVLLVIVPMNAKKMMIRVTRWWKICDCCHDYDDDLLHDRHIELLVRRLCPNEPLFKPQWPLLPGLSLLMPSLLGATLDMRRVLGCLCEDVDCRGVSVQAPCYSPASLRFFCRRRRRSKKPASRVQWRQEGERKTKKKEEGGEEKGKGKES
jgi:hypothetical protein